MCAAPHTAFEAHGDQAWTQILESLGLQHGTDPAVELAIGHDATYWSTRVRQGTLVLTSGISPVAQAFGIIPTDKSVEIRALIDPTDPSLEIIWQHSIHTSTFQLPPTATIFLRDRATQAPVMAGLRLESGALLWTATPLGEESYARYPSVPQALLALGLEPPLRSNRLWAFFDSSYRTRVDVDYFAERWRKAGIGTLHIAAWHYWEPDPQRDEFLARLIEACHRRAIQVYAWLEFPHVSDVFWGQHPKWREQTAAGQDAHLDWRKLMNLLEPECEREVWRGTQTLMRRFDWDGVNLAELYFESLEGSANAARFTPMNATIRERYQREHGLDPQQLFQYPDAARMTSFLDWRAGLAHELQETWLTKMESLRTDHPDLDIVLTHVDDRFDTRMRERIGADAASALEGLKRHDFTFLVEDPATIWNLGPARYPEIAARYAPINPRPRSLAVDINVVERYQDVYPTKRQVGTELTQLIHAAAQSFPRVALYFENSIRRQDYPLLPIASATGTVTRTATGLTIQSPFNIGVPWSGDALVNGHPWPVTDGRTVWLPPGKHNLEALSEPRTIVSGDSSKAAPAPEAHLTDLNAELTQAHADTGSLEFSYRSSARAYAIIDRKPNQIRIDSDPSPAGLTPLDNHWLLRLPRGQHVVTVAFDENIINGSHITQSVILK